LTLAWNNGNALPALTMDQTTPREQTLAQPAKPARMAIELRPPLPFDKGSAVRALLRAQERAHN